MVWRSLAKGPVSHLEGWLSQSLWFVEAVVFTLCQTCSETGLGTGFKTQTVVFMPDGLRHFRSAADGFRVQPARGAPAFRQRCLYFARSCCQFTRCLFCLGRRDSVLRRRRRTVFTFPQRHFLHPQSEGGGPDVSRGLFCAGTAHSPRKTARWLRLASNESLAREKRKTRVGNRCKYRPFYFSRFVKAIFGVYIAPAIFQRGGLPDKGWWARVVRRGRRHWKPNWEVECEDRCGNEAALQSSGRVIA